MHWGLSGWELEQYRRDGYLVRTSVLDRAELVELRRAAERSVGRAAAACASGRTYLLDGKRFVDLEFDVCGDAGAGRATVQFEHVPDSETIRVIEPVHPFDRCWDRLIDDPRLTEPMRALVGCEHLSLWTDKLNLKRPREGSGFGWHQDSPYWIHDCAHVDQLPNVYVALDDAGEANGCLRVIPGSHRGGCLPGTADGTQLGGFYTSPDAFDAAGQVALQVPAGSLVFFSPHIVHGSLPNASDLPRRAVVLTYQPGGQPMLKNGRVREVRIAASPAGDR
ncbi:MAG: phytanoyl-CoA dioxygenase family protein [Pseudomonadales bacterium]